MAVATEVSEWAGDEEPILGTGGRKATPMAYAFYGLNPFLHKLDPFHLYKKTSTAGAEGSMPKTQTVPETTETAPSLLK